MTVTPRTLAEAVRQGAQRLEVSGLSASDALTDAVLLARACLGWDAAQWLTYQQTTASPDFQSAFDRAIVRRAAHEPVAYVLGQREFYGRSFLVTPAVLIPRPETELVVEAALARLHGPMPRIADVGTGSGCLAVTLAAESAAAVIATDVSEPALRVAEQNAARHGVSAHVIFQHRPLLNPADGPFDIIVSNPPYVAEDDRETLPLDVRDHEPAIALFAGADGLDVIRTLVPLAIAVLAPAGYLLLEVGRGQSAAVSRIARAVGFSIESVRDDLAGIPRVVVARKA